MTSGTRGGVEVMSSISAVVEENSAATEEVSASAEEMSAQVAEMNAQAEELAATAEQLKSLVARFQIEDAPGAVVTRRQYSDWSAPTPVHSTRRAS